MMLVGLSFGQEITKELIGAGATAVFVTVLGGFTVGSLSRRSERRRHEYEVRNTMLERCSRVAGTMYMTCQTASRRLQKEQVDRDDEMARLGDAYYQFQVEQGSLENELGSRFGFRPIPLDGPGPRSPSGYVQARWHQVADLLTMYYFNLTNEFPGDVRRNNSLGHDDGFHSGIDFMAFDVPKDMPERRKDGLRAMRVDIRSTYRAAMQDLVQSLLTASVRTSR